MLIRWVLLKMNNIYGVVGQKKITHTIPRPAGFFVGELQQIPSLIWVSVIEIIYPLVI
jgi:hypothetical protein